MTVKIRFFTLTGKFGFGETKEFPNMVAATEAVIAYAEKAGFSKIKVVDDDDSLRFTATTPNGRAGRNVAELIEGWE